ncbi:MAG: 3-phosphoshikimate 1-carboxyvinyltransferase [Clostridia bacterium]|nr:3-phosphoshikimate 1-carboxyvinyltransferase [Clostridia bacterium]
MQISITPQRLSGKISVPTSKSMGHRIMICRYLASGRISAEGLTPSEDIAATERALRGMERGECHCGESGSTLRFMLPVALAKGGRFTFSGEGRLMQRPMDEYRSAFTQKGILWKQNNNVLTVSGSLKSGIYTLDGGVSSQYVTGLLLALPLLEGDSEIALTSPLQSASYVDITLSVQRQFGVECQRTSNGFYIKGGQKYTDRAVVPEADMSQAAFWLVANKLGSDLLMELPTNTLQGDGIIVKLLNENITDIDITDCPDLAPVLAVWLSQTGGRLRSCRRLRYKESDRLHAICRLLDSLNGSYALHGDDLEIHKTPLAGGEVDSFNDHRIAMAGAIAATVADGEVIITGAESVSKSYPDFWKHYISVGGKISECNLG